MMSMMTLGAFVAPTLVSGGLASTATLTLLTTLALGALFASRPREQAPRVRDGRARASDPGDRFAGRPVLTALPGRGGAERVTVMYSRILDLLVKDGLLDDEQARAVTEEQERTHEAVDTLLRRLGFLTEDELLGYLSEKFGIPVFGIQRIEVSEEITSLVRKEIVQKHQVFPLRKVGNTLTLALSDPTIPLAVDDVQFATGLHVIPVLAAESTLRDAIDRHYGGSPAQIDKLLKTEPGPGVEVLEVVDRTQKVDITDTIEQVSEAPIIRFVNLVLADAIRKRASDIHLEPHEKALQVRYRIDGVLHDVMTAPKSMEPAILSRVKIMASMDIAERRLPQDGRISVKLGAKEVDLRVSSLPTQYAEKIVMRILDKLDVVLDLATLGFEEDDLARFAAGIRSPHGMVLVTGPTGSGKSTTLYAAVSAINSPDVNIMTVEDPIEFNLHRVNQLQVREEIGLTFSAALRSFLRQDPDVILVGEMRDTETASIAIRAALTGHLVFSTLHTNDAPSSVTRLLDMGMAPFLVSSSVLMVVAQRLCRRICLDCREPVQVPLSVLLEVGFAPEEAESVTVYRGTGCVSCGNTGYRGRTSIHEILEVGPEIQQAIVQQRPASELKAIAVKQGMRTLRQAGLRKVARGVTTLDEVVRATYAH